MKLYLNTSTPTTILKLDDKTYTWHSNRLLAKNLLSFIDTKLKQNQKTFKDLTSLHFFTGPGSFTGLRIGATVLNTLAYALALPLYDQTGKKQNLLLPVYSSPPNTTQSPISPHPLTKVKVQKNHNKTLDQIPKTC